MSRPSRKQDVLLIEAAKRLLPKAGVSAMSLKEIACECGVNLGMFSYHFGTKDQFVKRVLESIYEDMFVEAEQLSKQEGSPVDRLRSTLLSIAFSMREHRKVFASLFQDLMNQEEEVAQFLFQKMSQNFELLIPLIEEAQESGEFEKIPLRQAGAFCMASINMPTLISEAMERASKNSKKSVRMAKVLETQLTTEESIRQRVDMALKALSAKPRRIL